MGPAHHATRTKIRSLGIHITRPVSLPAVLLPQSMGLGLGLLACCQVGNLLPRLHQALVVLLLQLSADLVERHEGRRAVDVAVAAGLFSV